MASDNMHTLISFRFSVSGLDSQEIFYRMIVENDPVAAKDFNQSSNIPAGNGHTREKCPASKLSSLQHTKKKRFNAFHCFTLYPNSPVFKFYPLTSSDLMKTLQSKSL